MSFNGMVSKSGEKISSRLKRASRPFRSIWPRTSDAVIGMVALVVVVLAALTYFKPVVETASGIMVGGSKYLAGIDGLINPFRNPNLLLSEDLPVYDLEISREQMDIVDASIEEAKAQGWMSDEMKTWADARFYYNGVEYNVDVRVRGDLGSHWEGPKKSWRIKFGKQNLEHNGEITREAIYFEGKRQINLIIPDDRDYVLAAFVNELMREDGLLVPRDKFVVLRINGIVQGLYYEVEHFDKPLMAAQGRPETTVFGQNDRALHFEQYTKYGMPGVTDAKYDMGTRRLQVDETGESAMQAMQVMQVLLDHSVNPSPASFEHVRSVMDWEKYLAFRNITTLLNTNHVRFGSDNLKLYFDPSKGLLEPIPWDAHLVRMPPEPGTIDYWNSHGTDEIQRSTLLNPDTRLQRNQMLWEWVSDGGDEIIARYDEWHNRIRPLVWVDVLKAPTQVARMDALRSDFIYNVRRVYKVLSLSNASVNFRLEADDRAALDVVSLNFSGTRLEGFEMADPYFEGDYQLYEDVNDNGELDSRDVLVAEATAENGRFHFTFERFISPELQYRGEIIDGRYWEFFDTLAGRTRYFVTGKLANPERHPLEWQIPEMSVVAYNAVTDERMPSALMDYQDALPIGHVGITAYDDSDVFDLDAPKLSQEAFLAAHPEFQASMTRPGAVELSGDVVIDGVIIIPETVPLILQPGTDITMRPFASILSYGGLIAQGTPQARITIHGDESGKAWGTLAVVRAPIPVEMAYIDVSGGGQAQINSTLFTGGVAVYNTDLTLSQCSIADMYSEDGINLKNGKVMVDNCVFARNASDSFDIDFGTGVVRDSFFMNNINDGLDISGSKVLVQNVRFEGNGDKGFSVGEDSHPTIVNALFKGNQIGIALKDLSHANISYATFVENVLAIEAKRKKEFFGGGSGDFVNAVFYGNQTLLDDDYFSAGQVSFVQTVADDQAACPGCERGIAEFRAPAAGDYRLQSGTYSGAAFDTSQIEWIQTAGAAETPQQPGTYSPLIQE